MNNASINMGVQVPYYNLTSIPWDISLGLVLLDHMAVPFFILFEEPPYCF
jgi:hypothetical protein